ncbi:MAG: hypothetical protein QXD13_01635 [Candidatus Pacearchaeota archaeon]
MGFFKEAKYVDYTLLKKKGILKVPEMGNTELRSDEGFVDVSAVMKNAPSDVDNSNLNTSSATPDLGFLGDMAGIGSTNSATNITNDSSGPINSDLSSMKVKIEDIEYKLDRLVDRLIKIEEKISSTVE